MNLSRAFTKRPVRDYFQERLQQIKQLDLDQVGRKDVDQMAEVAARVVEKLKVAIEATDFQTLGTGLEQVISRVPVEQFARKVTRAP